MFPERLKALIDALDTNPNKLAVEMGRSSKYLYGLLRGGTAHPKDYLFDYLEIRYNVNPDWLKWGQGDMFGPEGMTNRSRNATLFRELESLPKQDAAFVKQVMNALIREAKSRKAEEKLSN